MQLPSSREILRLTRGTGEHFAQRTLLEKSNLAKLLLAHLFITCAFQFFGPGLVDDIRNFILGEFATEKF